MEVIEDPVSKIQMGNL